MLPSLLVQIIPRDHVDIVFVVVVGGSSFQGLFCESAGLLYHHFFVLHSKYIIGLNISQITTL